MEPQKEPAIAAEVAKRITDRNKVIELRNPEGITRAVQYVQAELETYLQLGLADTEAKKMLAEVVTSLIKNIGIATDHTELSRNVDKLFDVLRELDQAAVDLIEGAQAQANEFAEELNRFKQGAAVPTISLQQVETEISRYKEWLDSIVGPQQQLEDERMKVKEDLDILKQSLEAGMTENETADRERKKGLENQVGVLTKTINQVIAKRDENSRFLQRLIAYQQAVELIASGSEPFEALIGRNLSDFSTQKNPPTSQ